MNSFYSIVNDEEGHAMIDGNKILMCHSTSKEMKWFPFASVQNEDESLTHEINVPEATTVKETETISHTTEPQEPKIWTRNETLALLTLYKSNEYLFKSTTIKNEKVWHIISANLKSQGFVKTSKQCEDKWKNLRKKYIQLKDSRKISGAKVIKFEFADEMDEIYGKKPNVCPLAIASTSSSPDPKKSEDETPKPKRMKKVENIDTQTKLLDTLQEKEINRERRHQEILQVQREAIENYNAMMGKLLDKLK